MFNRSNMSFRYVHKIVGLIGALLWVFTAITGMTFAVLVSSYVGYERKQVKIFLQLHQMSIIGVQRYYVLALGLLGIVQSVVGAVLVFRHYRAPSCSSVRLVHMVLSWMGGPVMLLMSVSGFMFRLNKSWLFRATEGSWWMDIHSGKFLGTPFYWPWWPLFVGSMFLALVVTGLYLSPQLRALLRPLKRAS